MRFHKVLKLDKYGHQFGGILRQTTRSLTDGFIGPLTWFNMIRAISLRPVYRIAISPIKSSLHWYQLNFDILENFFEDIEIAINC